MLTWSNGIPRRTVAAITLIGNMQLAKRGKSRCLLQHFRQQLACGLLVLAPALAIAADPVSYSHHTGSLTQFDITLPDGWSVYDQAAAVTGKRGPHGILIFSSQPLTGQGEQTPPVELLARVDTGALRSFFVDRQPLPKGVSCSKFSISAAYNLGVKLNEDSMFGAARNLLKAVPVKHERVSVGGCQGFRYHSAGKKGEWVLDVRAVSDGKVLYLFSLRNRAEHYPANIDTFERALGSLAFTTP